VTPTSPPRARLTEARDALSRAFELLEQAGPTLPELECHAVLTLRGELAER
jgi:hypothetical protein